MYNHKYLVKVFVAVLFGYRNTWNIF